MFNLFHKHVFSYENVAFLYSF